jgi:hypothetical protein
MVAKSVYTEQPVAPGLALRWVEAGKR